MASAVTTPPYGPCLLQTLMPACATCAVPTTSATAPMTTALARSPPNQEEPRASARILPLPAARRPDVAKCHPLQRQLSTAVDARLHLLPHDLHASSERLFARSSVDRAR